MWLGNRRFLRICTSRPELFYRMTVPCISPRFISWSVLPMKTRLPFHLLTFEALLVSIGLLAGLSATGATIHVSKLGDNSDGSSWEKAFRTIQAALNAVPNEQGAHRIVVRPDTYMEANLFPAHKGAAGAYNELVGDCDGTLGSGTRGRVIIDSGDPEKGFKSYDWWGPIRAYKKAWSVEHKEETFSSIGWDRWAFRGLYVTGGDGGLFFDLVDRAEPFSVCVEDCFSVGRAFGGGVANVLSRPGEPSVFRRCQLWCLDWWGDAAGAYNGGGNAHLVVSIKTEQAGNLACALPGQHNVVLKPDGDSGQSWRHVKNFPN